MKKTNVPSCFGRDGNTPCLMAFCGSSYLCHECYLEYWYKKQAGFNNIPINEYIEKFVQENNLKIEERRENPILRCINNSKYTKKRGR